MKASFCFPLVAPVVVDLTERLSVWGLLNLGKGAILPEAFPEGALWVDGNSVLVTGQDGNYLLKE